MNKRVIFEIDKPMNTFKKIEKYKYEGIAVIAFIGLLLIDEADSFHTTLSALIMIFGMFGMLAKTISPTVSVVNFDIDQIIKKIESNN